MLDEIDSRFMARALGLAEAAAGAGEVPVGAVLVDPATGSVVAEAANRTETDCDPTAHAEVVAIRLAGAARHSPRLPGLDLYVTLEPCAMCAAAIAFARIRRVIFAAPDPKGGGVLHGPRFYEQPTCHHRPAVLGPVEPQSERSGELLRNFFRARRKNRSG